MLDKAGALIDNHVYTEEEQQKLYKRTLIIVSISQMFGGAGLAAGITVEHFLRDKCLEQIHLQDYQLLCLHWDQH